MRLAGAGVQPRLWHVWCVEIEIVVERRHLVAHRLKQRACRFLLQADAAEVHAAQARALSSAMSAALDAQRAAAALARTCSGRVAPAMTEATAGCAARPPIATSSSRRPRCAA